MLMATQTYITRINYPYIATQVVRMHTVHPLIELVDQWHSTPMVSSFNKCRVFFQ